MAHVINRVQIVEVHPVRARMRPALVGVSACWWLWTSLVPGHVMPTQQNPKRAGDTQGLPNADTLMGWLGSGAQARVQIRQVRWRDWRANRRVAASMFELLGGRKDTDNGRTHTHLSAAVQT